MVNEDPGTKRLSAERLRGLQDQLGDLWKRAAVIQLDLEFDRRMRTRWASHYIFTAMRLIEDAHEQIEALLADE
jgi:hypothetical protein